MVVGGRLDVSLIGRVCLGNIKGEVIEMTSFRIPHPDMSPLEIPQPTPVPLHPGSERPEIGPPDSPPEQEPNIGSRT